MSCAESLWVYQVSYWTLGAMVILGYCVWCWVMRRHKHQHPFLLSACTRVACKICGRSVDDHGHCGTT